MKLQIERRDDRQFLWACRDFPGSPGSDPTVTVSGSVCGAQSRVGTRGCVRQRCQLFRDGLTDLTRATVFLATLACPHQVSGAEAVGTASHTDAASSWGSAASECATTVGCAGDAGATMRAA